MNKTNLEKLIEQRVRKIISRSLIKEDRLSQEYAEYKIKNDKITVLLKKQTASAFTKYAAQWEDLTKRSEKLLAETKRLQDIKNDIDDLEKEIKTGLKLDIGKLVDANELAMTIAVKCAGSVFTLSKETDINKDKVIPATTIEDIDYKKAWDAFSEMIAGNSGMLKMMDECLNASKNTITIAEKIIKGKERGIRISTVETEGKINEDLSDVWNKIKSAIIKMYNKIIGLLKSNTTKVNEFTKLVNIAIKNIN